MDAASPIEASAEDDILSEILGESITPAGPPEPIPGGRTEALASERESDPGYRIKALNPGSGPARNGQTEAPDPEPVETKDTKTRSADGPDLGARAPTRRPPGTNEDGIDGKRGRGSPAETNPAGPTANGLGHTQTKSPDSEISGPEGARKQNGANGPRAENQPKQQADAWAQNKAKGALFGAALGDALGLRTDGLHPSEVAERNPRGLKFPANVRLQGNQANDWSGLSDQMVLAMRTLREWRDRLTGEPEHAFAQKLVHWAKYGMTDLGDTASPTTDRLTREATKDPSFLLQPRSVAKKIQQRLGGNPEGASHSNPGALLRALPAAFVPENPLYWSGLLTGVTHAAPEDELAARCVVRFVWAAAQLEERPLAAEIVVRQLGRLLAEAQKLGLNDFEEAALPLFIDSRRLDFLSAVPPTAPGVRIGADLGGATVYRALACGLWVLRAFIRGEPRTPEFVKECLLRCASMGGAACANAGLVGALLGAAVGYTGLPADWLKALPFHDALASETDLFLKAGGPPAKNSKEGNSGTEPPPRT